MRNRSLSTLLGVALVVAAAGLPGGVAVNAQHGPAGAHDHSRGPTAGAASAPGHAHGAASAPGSVRIPMEELHALGGVPRGWRFTLPDGDASKGREVFAKLECYQCHETAGQSFPAVAKDPLRTGPSLTGMGGHHPVEYLAESILSPNKVIVTGPGYTGSDGLSVMPDYRDSLTLGEWIDLVAFLKSLSGHGAHDRHR